MTHGHATHPEAVEKYNPQWLGSAQHCHAVLSAGIVQLTIGVPLDWAGSHTADAAISSAELVREHLYVCTLGDAMPARHQLYLWAC